MRDVMAKMFVAPTFSDPEQTRSARWLHTFLLMALIVLVSYASATMVASWLGANIVTIPPITAVVAVAILFGIWRLMYQGLLHLAITATIATLFIIPTYLNLVVYQSIRSPDIWVYFILIPLTGLLLGRRQMLYFALLCLTFIGLLFYLETAQLIQPQISTQPTMIDGLLLGVSILLSTLLSQATIHKAEAKAIEAEQSLAALLYSNQQLERSQQQLEQAQSELESRVADRTQELERSNQRLQSEIDERQRLMEALGKSEANWRSLVQNAPETIITFDIDGTIRFVNRTLSYKSPEQLIQNPITAIHDDEHHRQKLVQAINQVVGSGATVSYESQELVGEQRYWRINRIGPIHEAGQLRALILLSTDITEQKLAEAAMLQSQKLESLGIMAGGVAHDFNNLLTAMIGQATLALNKLGPNQLIVRDHIQNLLFASHRATDLTRQMLNYAGHSPTDFVPVNLNRLLQENIQFFSASISKTIDLRGDLATDLPDIMGDPGQIQQLVMNLILNAADAIGEQVGEITIVTTVCTDTDNDLQNNEQYHLRWSERSCDKGDYICLSIRDTGCGMDEMTLNKIFDPFFTTKFTGRGLGLASVIGIVRAHEGGIYVTSAPQVGTTFQILFPITEIQIAEEKRPITTNDYTGLAGKLILLIDDEDDVRQVTTEILELSDIRTLNANNGIKGIELFEQHLDEIDLVMVDLSMPGMSGEDVVKRLWEIKPGISIVVLSGYDEYEVSRRLDSRYAVDFLQKPYNLDGLLGMIARQFSKSTLPQKSASNETVLAESTV